MTTYKGIRGLTIRTVAGDLSPVALGDIWYNSVAKKIRIGKTTVAAWASGGDMTGTRYAMSGSGTATAGLCVGGTSESALSEEYDGSSWTEGSNLNDGRGRSHNNVGTQTAGLLAMGDSATVNVEEYNGTSWTEVNNTPTAIKRNAGLGTETAAFIFGGYLSPSPPPANAVLSTFEYDGTNWTDGGDLGVAAYNMLGFGTQTAGIGTGGYDGPPVKSETWDYNGTAWTDTSGDINTARFDGGSAGVVSTAGIIFGGDKQPGTADNTESYDGTSWTEVGDLTVQRQQLGAGGTYASGLAMGGHNGTAAVATTEEWTGDSTDAASVTSS